MMLSISAFWIVLLIVIIHTIFQHLINWGWRNTNGDDSSEFMMTILTVFELLFLICCLYSTLY